MSPNQLLLSALAFVPSLPFSYNSFFEGHHWHLGIFQEVQGLKEKPCWILLKCTQFCKYLSSGHLPYFYPPPALLFPFSTISWLSLPFPPSLECCQPRLCLLTSHHDCHIFLAGSIYVPLNPVSCSASAVVTKKRERVLVISVRFPQCLHLVSVTLLPGPSSD